MQYQGLSSDEPGTTSAANGTAKALKTYAYTSFLPRVAGQSCATTRRGGASGGHGEPEAGQRLVRFLLQWNPFPSRDAAGVPAVTAHDDSVCLSPLWRGTGALSLEEPADVLPDAFSAVTRFSLPPAKLALGLALLALTVAAAYWARRKLMVFELPPAPTLQEVLNRLPKGSHGVMLIGAPRTRKDEIVTTWLTKECRVLTDRRIRLLGVSLTREFIEAEVAALRSLPNPGRRLWIHVSNIETHLVNARRRRHLLELLDALLVPSAEGQERVLIITTTIDPIVHFEEIFDEERKRIYSTPVPEIALSRVSLLLTRFRRCYAAIPCGDSRDPWWHYDASQWRRVLAWETRNPYPGGSGVTPLRYVEEEVEHDWRAEDRVPATELSAAVSARAYAYYQLLWTSCTRHEKLVLVQLAQEGLVTSHSADVVGALMAKGMIVARPGPTIFNHSFRRFLRRIERNEVVRDWERGDGEGLWVLAGRMIASSVAAGGLFFLLTQGYSAEALLPVLSGTGAFGVPLLRDFVVRLTGSTASAGASTHT